MPASALKASSILGSGLKGRTVFLFLSASVQIELQRQQERGGVTNLRYFLLLAVFQSGSPEKD